MSGNKDLFDLHVHTVASDGVYSSMQIAELARRSGLAGLALTDHDALADPHVLDRLSRRYGVAMLAGVELSTRRDDLRLHLLGYGIDSLNEELVSTCRSLQMERRQRCRFMIDDLSNRGVKLARRDLAALERCLAPGRRHLARLLVQAGHVSNVRVAFRRYLQHIGEAPFALEFGDAVDLVHRAGGVAVLAHPPPWMNQRQWRDVLSAGIDGIEGRFPASNRRHQKRLFRFATENELSVTAGSDFHGDERREYLGRENLDRAALGQLLANTFQSDWAQRLSRSLDDSLRVLVE